MLAASFAARLSRKSIASEIAEKMRWKSREGAAEIVLPKKVLPKIVLPKALPRECCRDSAAEGAVEIMLPKVLPR
eukprot:SAG31_NODE_60_length_29419_cov_39.876398_26_plen_75_part_00